MEPTAEYITAGKNDYGVYYVTYLINDQHYTSYPFLGYKKKEAHSLAAAYAIYDARTSAHLTRHPSLQQLVKGITQ